MHVSERLCYGALWLEWLEAGHERTGKRGSASSGGADQEFNKEFGRTVGVATSSSKEGVVTPKTNGIVLNQQESETMGGKIQQGTITAVGMSQPRKTVTKMLKVMRPNKQN